MIPMYDPNDPYNPDFKVMPLFDAKYRRRLKIGNTAIVAIEDV